MLSVTYPEDRIFVVVLNVMAPIHDCLKYNFGHTGQQTPISFWSHWRKKLLALPAGYGMLSLSLFLVYSKLCYAICIKAGNTKGGSITVPLISCLTGLD